MDASTQTSKFHFDYGYHKADRHIKLKS